MTSRRYFLLGVGVGHTYRLFLKSTCDVTPLFSASLQLPSVIFNLMYLKFEVDILGDVVEWLLRTVKGRTKLNVMIY